MLELKKQESERKMYLIGQLLDYKIDPTRQLYSYTNVESGFILIGQPVNPHYQPEDFTVENNGTSYYFQKIAKSFLPDNLTNEDDSKITPNESNESTSEECNETSESSS